MSNSWYRIKVLCLLELFRLWTALCVVYVVLEKEKSFAFALPFKCLIGSSSVYSESERRHWRMLIPLVHAVLC